MDLLVSGMEDISDGLECRPIPCQPRSTGTSSNPLYPTKFRYVRRNIPGPGCETDLFEDQLCGCDCLHGCRQETCPCLRRFGPNYLLETGQLTVGAVSSSSQKPIVECNSQCACDTACSNRMVQHGPRIKLRVAPSGVKGFGLFASEEVKELTFVCEYAGEVVSTSEAGRRLQRKDNGMNYVIVLREHCQTGVVLTCVDPQHMGNIGRFANHSCDPNLLMLPVRVDNSVPRLALFARRDIAAGEELSFDYSGETLLHSQPSSDGSQSAEFRHREKGSLAASQGKTSVQSENNMAVITCEMHTRDNYLECEHFQTNACGRRENSESDQNHEICQKCVNGCGNSSANGRTVIKASSYPARHDSNAASYGKTLNGCDNDASSACASDVLNRKRRLSYGTDNKSGEPHGKQSVLLAVGVTRKECLCGSSLCKGYLPFDKYIFNS